MPQPSNTTPQESSAFATTVSKVGVTLAAGTLGLATYDILKDGYSPHVAAAAGLAGVASLIGTGVLCYQQRIASQQGAFVEQEEARQAMPIPNGPNLV